MHKDYRLTIRTDPNTANSFRRLAKDGKLSLGDLLTHMVGQWLPENEDGHENIITDWNSPDDLAKLYWN